MWIGLNVCVDWCECGCVDWCEYECNWREYEECGLLCLWVYIAMKVNMWTVDMWTGECDLCECECD